MYGSSLRLVTRTPREVRIAASDAAAMPFPSEETTPPVTNTNLVIGWPVPEIGILPECGLARNARAAKSRGRDARCCVVTTSACDVEPARHPRSRGVASDELQHRI